MNQASNYREVFKEQYDKYSQYEIPAALAAGVAILRKSTQEEDFRGIDLVWQWPNLAVRTREFSENFFHINRNEFTIRSKVPEGHLTELDKLIRGEHADVMVYDWIERKDVKHWMLLDLKKVAAVLRRMNLENILFNKCEEKLSPKNDTYFIICKLEDFPGALIASSFAGEKC